MPYLALGHARLPNELQNRKCLLDVLDYLLAWAGESGCADDTGIRRQRMTKDGRILGLTVV
jgi:hypothetical protein